MTKHYVSMWRVNIVKGTHYNLHYSRFLHLCSKRLLVPFVTVYFDKWG